MFDKQSMINRLSNPVNRNRSAAKISKVMSSSTDSCDDSYVRHCILSHTVIQDLTANIDFQYSQLALMSIRALTFTRLCAQKKIAGNLT